MFIDMEYRDYIHILYGKQVENKQTDRFQARKASLLEIGDAKTLVRQSKFSC